MYHSFLQIFFRCALIVSLSSHQAHLPLIKHTGRATDTLLIQGLRRILLQSVSHILTVGLGLETLDDEPEWQRQLKEETGDCERWESSDEADVDPEDFSDAPRHETRVADQARNRQPSGDQPGPEQQRTQEEGPKSEHCLANLVGHGVRLDQE